MRFTVVIPARYSSTRLPGKLLLDLAGKPIIQHVYERALASGAEQVIVATDHEEIARAVENFSGEVVITSEQHQSGTDRIAEVVEKKSLPDQAVIVNVQGDEPLIDPEIIRRAAENLQTHGEASIATVCTTIRSVEDIVNPNVVKVVMDDRNFALYFSRAPIPWHREWFAGLLAGQKLSENLTDLGVDYYHHIGIYAYRAAFLKTYVSLPQSLLEKTEALEQLRALSNGHKIYVDVLPGIDVVGVDTREDYEKLKEIIGRR